MKVVCVTGMPACGKEEFLKLARLKGFTVVRMGDVVREEAARAGIPIKDPDVGNFASEQRRKHGFDIWAKKTLPKISGGFVLVDGIRGPSELAVYQATFPKGLRVVAVHSSPETRMRRMMRRARQDDPANETEFRARDARELNWGIGEVIALADHMIVNEGDLATFKAQATATLDKIISEGK